MNLFKLQRAVSTQMKVNDFSQDVKQSKTNYWRKQNTGTMFKVKNLLDKRYGGAYDTGHVKYGMSYIVEELFPPL
jgi:hypothetical protein